MYIISHIGFFSLARLPDSDQDGPTFVVRSRARRDLHDLLAAARLDLPPLHTPERDYPWRVHVNADGLRRVLLALGETVCAGGELKQHPSRGDLYGTIWAMMAAGISDV